MARGPLASEGSSTSLLHQALEYAAQGLPVLPCDPNTKRPLVAAKLTGDGGVKMATTDATQIAAWWRARPDAMIGMRCGSKDAGGPGFIVLDFDPKDDSTAPELLAATCRYMEKLLGVTTT